MSSSKSWSGIGNLIAAAGLIALGVWKRILQSHFFTNPSLEQDFLGFIVTFLLACVVLSVAIFIWTSFSEGGWRYALEEWTWTVLSVGAGAALSLLLPFSPDTRVGFGFLSIIIGLASDSFSEPHVGFSSDAEEEHEEVGSYVSLADKWHRNHPYKRDRYRSTLILEDDGSGMITRQIYGFKPRVYEAQKKIEKHTKFDYPDAEVGDFSIDPIDDDHTFVPEDDINIGDKIIHGHFTIPGPLFPGDDYSWKTTLRFGQLFPMSWEESTEVYPDRDWRGPCHVLGMRYPTDVLVARVIFPSSWASHWDHIDPSLFVGWEWSAEQHEAVSEMSDNFLRWEEGAGFSRLSRVCPDWAREELGKLETDLGSYGDGGRPWAMTMVRKPWPEFMFGVCWKPPRQGGEPAG